MRLGLPELLIILLIIIIIFGVGRISKVAGELGSGIRAFREGLQKCKVYDLKTTVEVGLETRFHAIKKSHILFRLFFFKVEDFPCPARVHDIRVSNR
jgi:sec-independent protein translocase protein TatA